MFEEYGTENLDTLLKAQWVLCLWLKFGPKFDLGCQGEERQRLGTKSPSVLVPPVSSLPKVKVPTVLLYLN